ncbi:hypothetical protein EON65_20815 [archaeon]|nr:MAG: hypothetical protein EON65_20815 [archaeon]
MRVLLVTVAVSAVLAFGKELDFRSVVDSVWHNGTTIDHLASGDFSYLKLALQSLLESKFDATVKEMEEMHLLQRPHSKVCLTILI